MPFYQGLGPFVFAAVLMAAGLLIQWVASIRMDASRTEIIERISNAMALLGALLGTQFRTSEYLYGASRFGRTDTLPGPAVIVLMSGIYISLRVLVTSYVQYRKHRDDPELSKKLIKDAVGTLVLLAVIFALAIAMEALQRS